MKKEKLTYAEMLKDPRWINRAKEIKEWDRESCQLCGSHENLQVHHLYYDKDKEVWQYGDRALVTLCDKCHEEIHKCDKHFYEYLNDLLHKLGEDGVTKFMVLDILDAFSRITEYPSDKNLDLLSEFICKYSSGSFHYSNLIFQRLRKNNQWKEYRQRQKELVAYAKKAYEWATNKKDFDEDKFWDGDYEYEIQEYKDFFGEED